MKFKGGTAVRVTKRVVGRVISADRVRPEPVYRIAVHIDPHQGLDQAEKITGVRIIEAERHQMKPA